MRLSEWLAANPKVTQRELGATVGVTQGRIAQLIQGDLPSLDLAQRISLATAGEVTPNDWPAPKRVLPTHQEQAGAA